MCLSANSGPDENGLIEYFLLGTVKQFSFFWSFGAKKRAGHFDPLSVLPLMASNRFCEYINFLISQRFFRRTRYA
jgi:hypothetical protein